jgi:DNA (cytosine-5)-methyltransferase 1
MIPVIDIFAGPGGLGEGFSAFTEENDRPAFKIRLSIEKEANAHRTLRLRSFFRQFSRSTVPDDYYEVLRQNLSVDTLYERHPVEASRASAESIQHTLEEGTWPRTEALIGEALSGAEDWVLIGGPPCQAYSVAGRSRNKGIEDYSARADGRHFLYREYLRILARFRPTVFVMENVKGLLSSKPDGSLIFDTIKRDLKSPSAAMEQEGTVLAAVRYKLYSLAPSYGSSGEEFVLKAESHGIPQTRHRVIVVGVREDVGDLKPACLPECDAITVRSVLAGLPTIRSGLSSTSRDSIKEDSPKKWQGFLLDGIGRRWLESADSRGGEGMTYFAERTLNQIVRPKHNRGSEFIPFEVSIGYKPDWFLDKKIGGVCNHASRTHMGKDLYRYFYAACYAELNDVSPRLKDFPRDLLPVHENIEQALAEGNLFQDRFRVQLWDKPSTTVTSHIAKDGHYYIHPDPKQCRSLTVREAARLQTFPDNYFFTGPRTAQYVQVGNAVPPLLAIAIAESVFKMLRRAKSAPHGPQLEYGSD